VAEGLEFVDERVREPHPGCDLDAALFEHDGARVDEVAFRDVWVVAGAGDIVAGGEARG
jgi:hypothetical protein